MEKPVKQPSFNAKLGWTFMALLLYIIMLKTPVYGYQDQGQDPFAALRIILASQRGTLAELGIGPIVTSGMILQLLVGSKIISVNFDDTEERVLYTGTQKVLAIAMTLFEAIAYIAGGTFTYSSVVRPSFMKFDDSDLIRSSLYFRSLISISITFKTSGAEFEANLILFFSNKLSTNIIKY